MTKSIYLLLSLLLLTLTFAQPTILTYVVQEQIDQEDNYVQITLSVQTEGNKLAQALSKAEETINKIKKITEQHCESKSNKQEKKNCKDIVDVSPYEIEPKYHLVRKVTTFNLFIVTHQVTVQIKNIDGIGSMIDKILIESEELITLHEFAWKAHQEVDSELHTLKKGVEEGRDLCKQLGKTLGDVLGVQEVGVQQEQEGDEERDADLAIQDVEQTIFKFKVLCVDKKK